MDELCAAIAAFLRERNTRLTAGRAPVERVWTGSLRAYTGRMPHCRYCGAAIVDGGGLFDLEKLRADRTCHQCYVPF